MSDFKRPRKFLGQNFLTDQNIQKKIVNSIDHLEDISEIVEIGPGRGALTEHLMKLEKRLTIIEFDRDLADFWRSQSIPKLRLIESDFLKIDFSKEFGSNEQRVFIGNIPYNITSQIIFKLMDHTNLFKQVILMMQKEVAERLSADSGSKIYGILSILCGLQFDIKKLFDVPRTVFNPRPKVDSTVVRLVPKQIDKRLENHQLFIEIVKRSFNQRRKMLRGSLKQYVAAYNGSIDLSRRPEQLSIAEFITLSNELNVRNP